MSETRIFTSREFDRFARKARIDDETLVTVVSRIENGLADADLGGGVIKQRVAREGSGKSGGFRTFIVFKMADRAVYVEGFAKNVKANLSTTDVDL